MGALLKGDAVKVMPCSCPFVSCVGRRRPTLSALLSETHDLAGPISRLDFSDRHEIWGQLVLTLENKAQRVFSIGSSIQQKGNRCQCIFHWSEDPGRAGGRCSAHESVMPGEAILTPAGVPGSPGPIPSSPCSCAIHRSAPPFRRNLIFDPTASRHVDPALSGRTAGHSRGGGQPSSPDSGSSPPLPVNSTPGPETQQRF